ncbi:sensor histidine kinase [Haloactinomyces albus]|uniref:histidine kinase n=1 Tax=Haloactinomyces albus TaxID=1352928 RepID=A0AAE3Z9D1_9ACTN|nr:HAMP domain-containing sensor histidine kinase [Haloactinomyces albus]MDR7300738.1 two-component system OmpR family sensor kinase [Haloactinomyces albus]
MRRLLRPGSWTLRTRLVLALLLLTTLGLVTVGGSSALLLHHSLVGKVDERLAGLAHPWREGQPPPEPPRPPSGGVGERELPTDFRVLFFDSEYRLQGVIGQVPGDSSAPRVAPTRMRALCEQGGAITVPDTAGGAPWRLRCEILPEGDVIGVALSLVGVQATVNRLVMIEVIVGTAVLIVLAVVAAVVVRMGLLPLSRIEQTAETIAGGDFDRRVPEHDSRTEPGRLAAALNTMLERLSEARHEREQSEQRLRHFVADASHELRTPLTSIRGFAELYRQGGADEPEDVARLMSRIEQESQRMGTLVEDLLLLARLDRARSLELGDLDLVPLLDDVVHDARTRAPERRIAVSLPDPPVRIPADRNRLRQVLDNILTNALVHTPPEASIRMSAGYGTVREREPVAATGSDLVPGTRLAVVEIGDDGPGIATEHAGRIFDRFYRVADGRGRATGGTGLGLAIAAAVVGAHGGRIELFSATGEGTVFRVLLPLT